MELIAPVRVVVVDDNAEHLFAIVNALSVSGIPCVWHLYDNDSNTLLPTPPSTGYNDIRLVITDLNIRNFSGTLVEPKNLGATLLAEVLKPIVPKSDVPYGLVLWSSVSGVVDEVCSFIYERISHQSLDEQDRRAAPLSIQLMKKGEFIADLNAGDTSVRGLILATSKGLEQVRAQLSRALSDPQLRMACAWEARVSQAASATINTMYEAAAIYVKDSRDDELNPTIVKPTDALKVVLAKLANEAAGRENAAEDPARALDDGLLDVFVDDLRSFEDNENYRKIVQASLGGLLGKRIGLSPSVRDHLNTSLHVETRRSIAGGRISRGLVLGCDDEDKIAARLGKQAARKVLWSEFLFTVNQFKSAAETAGLDKRHGWEELGKLYEKAKADEADVEKECRIRLLEIGADCDHANRKERTVRLLCALEIPERLSYFMTRPGQSYGYKSDSVIRLGPWSLGKDRRRALLLVSVGRFAIEQKWPLPPDLKPQYRLRRPIVDSVLHAYASHSSRLGYVAITE